jgi:hypothetical protein
MRGEIVDVNANFRCFDTESGQIDANMKWYRLLEIHSGIIEWRDLFELFFYRGGHL